MKKLVNEKGELVLKRLPWMQDVMTHTYNFVVIAAITRGSLDGAWEYEITQYLKRMYKSGHLLTRNAIQRLLDETGAQGLNEQFDRAGYLITQSKCPQNEE